MRRIHVVARRRELAAASTIGHQHETSIAGQSPKVGRNSTGIIKSPGRPSVIAIAQF
jgi:hypothetical protein